MFLLGHLVEGGGGGEGKWEFVGGGGVTPNPHRYALCLPTIDDVTKWRRGRRTLLNATKLSQKTPTLSAQHWSIRCITLGSLIDENRMNEYAVKVQRSLAPLSRFHGSHITTAHEQCCRFKSYAKSVPSPMKFTSEIDKA